MTEEKQESPTQEGLNLDTSAEKMRLIRLDFVGCSIEVDVTKTNSKDDVAAILTDLANQYRDHGKLDL